MYCRVLKACSNKVKYFLLLPFNKISCPVAIASFEFVFILLEHDKILRFFTNLLQTTFVDVKFHCGVCHEPRGYVPVNAF